MSQGTSHALSADLTVDAETAELRSTPFALHDPSPPLAPISHITVTDPAVLVRYPGFLAGRDQVEMRDQHVFVRECEDFRRCQGGEVEVP